MFKCSIGREDLLKPLGQISGVAGNNPKSPITSNVLLEIMPGGDAAEDARFRLRMVCTDSEIQMSTEVNLFCDDAETGSTTVNVKILLEILKKLPDGAYVSLAEDRSGKLLISSGKYKSFMMTMDPESFPAIESLETLYSLKIEMSELLEIMRTTKFSIAADSYRLFLKGMHFSVTGDEHTSLDIATADTHRMSLQKGRLSEPCEIPEAAGDQGFIFPKKGVDQLVALMSDIKDNSGDGVPVTLNISKNSLQTEVGGISLLSILIDAKFPNVNAVVPSNCGRILVLDRKVFQNTVTRVSIMSNSLNKAVEIVMQEGVLTLKAKNAIHEEAKDIMDYIDYSGDNFEIAFNADYLLQICNVIPTAKIKFSMSVSSNNFLIEPLPEENEKQTFARYVVSRVTV